METMCSFPRCKAAAQHFVLHSTHKQPLCPLHLFDSQQEVKPVSSWNAFTARERLGTQAQREAVCLRAIKVLSKIEHREIAETRKLQNFFEQPFVAKLGKANLLTRHFLTNSSSLFTTSDLAAIKSTKNKSVRDSAIQNSFEQAVVRRLQEEVRGLIGSLRTELQLHIENHSVELSPLASALVVSQDLLERYLPCLVDGESILKSPNVLQTIKEIDTEKLLSESLSFCLRQNPSYFSLISMKDRFSSQGNDVDLSVFQRMPAECRRIYASLETEPRVWFYSTENHCLVNLADELASQGYCLHAQVLLMSSSSNDTEDLGELQSYAFTRNAGAVVAHNEGNYRACLQLTRNSLAVREHLRECEVSLEQVYENLVAVSDTIGDHHRAALAVKRLWALFPGRDLPVAQTVDLVHKISAHYFQSFHLTEAETWATKAVSLAKSMQPENPRALFITLNTLASIYDHLDQTSKSADCLRTALELCYRVGAAPKPFADICAKLAVLELQLQNFDVAETLIQQAVENNEKSCAYVRGLYCQRLEKVQEARTILFKLTRKKPKLFGCLLRMIEIAVYQESLPEAVYWAKRFQRSCDNVQQMWLICAGMADIELARRNYGEVLIWLDREVETRKQHSPDFPLSTEKIRKRGLALAGLSRFEEAETLVKEALAKDTAFFQESHKTGKDLGLLGMIYVKCARFSEAEDCLWQSVLILEKGLPQQSALSTVYTNLGRISIHKEDFIGTEERLRKAIDIDEALRPGHSHLGETYNLLGETLKRLDRLDDAIEAYMKAVAILSTKSFTQVETGEVCQVLAELCAVQGRAEEAQYYAEAAISYPKSPNFP